MIQNKYRLVPMLLLGGTLSLLSSCGREPSDEQESKVSTPVAAVPVSSQTLPDSAFHVEWLQLEVPPTMSSGKAITAKVSFRNTSPNSWPNPKIANPAKPDGAYAVRLSYRWLKRGEATPISNYGERTDLSTSLRPGQSATLLVSVKAPQLPGDYSLQFDLVEELVSWFEEKGAPKALVPIKVS